MIKIFWLPKEVIYYAIVPMIIILLIYVIFSIIYKKKKEKDYYYNYVSDHMYATFGIMFFSILFCLLLGYSIATVQVLNLIGIIHEYLILAIIIGILPVVPFAFLMYMTVIYFKNLKYKEKLDNEIRGDSILVKK